MPNIRIKDIPTTASATSSTDFIGIDGSANGTRKLNAFSPTFGGNLTVSGTAGLGVPNGSYGETSAVTIQGTGKTDPIFVNVNGTSANRYLRMINGGTGGGFIGTGGSNLTIGTGTSTTAITLSGANTTLAGNLTVSGTGTSSVAGNLGVGTTSPQQKLHVEDASNNYQLRLGSTGNFTYDIGRSGANGYFQFYGNQTSLNGYIFGGVDGEKMRLNTSGNLLLKSDGVDSGNGKLQLATHTTSAGGIGFGTDTALFRSAAGALQLESSTTAVFEIDGAAANTRGVVIQAAGTEQAAITVAASGTSLLLSTGSPRTTALTLDSSQNATFAGDIRFAAGNAYDIGATGTRARTAYIKTLVITSGPPATASSTGSAGTITWDANYIYVCTATDTWKRVAIATW